MLWSDFYSYVSPSVIGCPDPLIERHALLASIEFCRKTLCWQKTLDPVIADGFNSIVDMVCDVGAQIIKVKSVSVDGLSHPLTDSINGLALVRSGSTQNYCFTQDNKTLYVSPIQVDGIEIVVDAALAPTIDAASLDDVVGETYIQDIAAGAIASILRIPKQDWTDPNAAQGYQQQFYSRCATVASKVSRGFMAQKMRSHATYL